MRRVRQHLRRRRHARESLQHEPLMRVFSEADLDTVSTVSGDLLVHSEHSVLEDDYADDLIQSEHPTREETLMAVEEPDLGQSLQLWVSNANALIQSPEMHALVDSSKSVLLQLSGSAVHGAVEVVQLPFKIPLHLTCFTIHLVEGTCRAILQTSFGMIHCVLPMAENTHAAAVRSESTEDVSLATTQLEDDDDDDDSLNQKSPVDQIVHHVTNAVPMVLGAADEIKNAVGAFLLGLASPLLPQENKSEAVSEKEQAAKLDRLRLDFEGQVTEEKLSFVGKHSVRCSKFLLRVNDLDLTSSKGHTLYYIDLDPESQDKQLSSLALERLLRDGLALVLLGNNPQNVKNKFHHAIEWKTEGATKKVLKKQAHAKWFAFMERHVLLWSGHFVADKSTPVFLARGVVPGSPLELYRLLWDNSRTREYNRFCMGRTDALVINEDIKVVKSETRVPFTGLSVNMLTLMYGHQVTSNTYVIVSRSLNAGGAGYHTTGRGMDRKNEITWGINLLQPVPGKSGVTDLIAFSQVSSGLVPKFLTHRVGIVAVENCFNALRTRNGVDEAIKLTDNILPATTRVGAQ